jgi:excisionase family DNA binding protein
MEMSTSDDGGGNERRRPVDPNPLTALLTIADVARALQMSIRTVRRIVTRGDLPCVLIGRQYRVEPAVFEKFVAVRRMPVESVTTNRREDIV